MLLRTVASRAVVNRQASCEHLTGLLCIYQSKCEVLLLYLFYKYSYLLSRNYIVKLFWITNNVLNWLYTDNPHKSKLQQLQCQYELNNARNNHFTQNTLA